MRDAIQDSIISPFYVHITEQLTDIFTKAIGKRQFDFYLASWASMIYMLQLEGGGVLEKYIKYIFNLDIYYKIKKLYIEVYIHNLNYIILGDWMIE